MTIVVDPPLVAFVDDDVAYRSWLAAHPDGFVLNTTRSPRADYLTLHSATCRHICGDERRRWTTNYAKVCGPSAASIDAWATGLFSIPADRCLLCLARSDLT